MIRIIFYAFIAAFSTFLFGYHTGIIAGALVFLTPDFQLTIFQQQLVVSILLFSGGIGTFLGGWLADAWGRKKTLFISALFFFLGTFLLMEARELEMLLLGRFMIGLAIAISMITAPLYISEISPPKIRGALVTMGQFMTAIGILIAYIIAFAFASQKDWRAMFNGGFIPLGFFFVGLFFIPESPLWLKSRGFERSPIKEKVFSPSLLKPMWIGMALSIFQQITGINTIIYYAPTIFEKAGFLTTESAIYNTMLIGIVNAFFTVLVFFFIDRIGRRSLLIIGIAGMAFSMALLSVSLAAQMSYLTLFSLFSYIASFAISLGPVLGIFLAEIFPQKIRGRAMGIAFFANWASNFIVSLTFLTLVYTIGIVLTFSLFTIICLIALWFVWKMIPETKGKTFEEIQKFWG